MNNPLNILILEDHDTDAALIIRELKKNGLQFDFRVMYNRQEFIQALKELQPDIVLSDYSMPQFTGLEAIEIIANDYPHIPIIIITGSVSEEIAVECIKLGACDYILKDNMIRLSSAVGSALEKYQLRAGKIRAEQELKESEKKFRSSFESADVGMALVDIDGNFINLNQAVCRVLEYNQDELLHLTFLDITHPEDIEQSAARYQQCLNDHKHYTIEKRYRTKTGKTKWGLTTISPVVGSSGEFQYAIAHLQDITDRKIAEERLIESKNELSLTLDATTDGIWTWNFKSDSMSFSPRYYQMLGYEPNEFEASFDNWLSLIHPEDREQALSVANKWLETKPDAYENIFRLKCKDGTYRWIISQAKVVERDSNGDALRMIGHHQDVTERKEAEEALKKSEAKYRTYVENAPEGIFIVDENGKYIDVNDAACEMTGYSREELLLMTIGELVAPDFADEGILRFRKLVGSGRINDEIRLKRKDGSIIDTTLRAVALGNNRFMGFCIDISKRKRAEELVRSNEARLRDILDSTPFPIAVVDEEDNHIEYWSKSALDLFGHTAPTTEKWYQLAYPDPDYREDVINRWKPALETARETGEAVNTGIYKVACKDGSARLCELYASFVADRLIVTFNDVTQIKEAEEKLKRNRLYLEKAQELGKMGSWELDLKANKLVWTDETYRIFGLPIGTELTFETFLSCLHPDDVEYVDRKWKAALEGQPYDIEHRIIANGATKWVREKAEIDFDSDGTIVRGAGFAQDITERKLAEQKLQQSERQHQRAQSVAHIGHWELDPKVGTPVWSDEIFKIFGLDPQSNEPSFTDHETHLHPDDWPLLNEAVTMASLEGTPFNLQFRIQRPNGEIRWMHAISETAFDENGRVSKIFGTAQDITERKEAEIKLRTAYAETRKRASEVSALLMGAKAILDSKEFNQTARRIFDYCSELIGSRSGYVALLSSDGMENELLFLESGGLPCDVDPALPMPNRGLRETAYRSKKAVYDNDFMSSEWIKFMPEGHVEMKNVLFAPLLIENEAVGLIGLANKEDDFTDDDARIATAFGELAAIALKNARAEEALSKNLHSLNLGESLAGLGYFERNWQSGEGYWSEGFYRLLGESPEQVDCRHAEFMRYVHSEDVERVQNHIKGTINNHEDMDIEFRLIQANGNVLNVHGKGKNFYDGDGKPLSTIGTFLDITERKKAEEDREKLLLELKERVKEITCLYQVAELIQAEIALEDMLGKISQTITSGLQYPEIARVKILFEGKEYVSQPFKETEWKLSSDIAIRGSRLGSIEVFYIEERPEFNEDPFIKEEKNLLIEIARNISQEIERKEAEKKLSDSETKFRTLFQSLPLGITVSDNQGNILESNEVSEKLLGLAKEEHTQRSINGKEWRIIKSDGSPFPADEYASVRALKENRLVENVEMGIVKDDDEVTWINVSAIPIPLEDYGVLIAYSDITDIKKAEEALALSEKRLNEAQKIANIGDVTWNVDTGEVWWSEGMHEMMGYDTEEILDYARVNAEVHHPEDLPRVTKWLLDTLESGAEEIQPNEYRIIKKDGEVIYVRSMGVVKREADGHTKMFATVQDISERRRVEVELEKSNRRMRDFAAHMQIMLEKERTAIAREIHDELGQTLSALKIDISGLESEFQKEQSSLYEITESMKHLIDRTADTVSRISTELRPGLLDDLGLAAAIDWQIGEFKKRHPVKCKASLKINEGLYSKDLSTAIFRVFQEALTNILRHANATKIEVKMTDDKRSTTLRVHDNGIGIAKNLIEDSKSYGLIGMRERVNHFGGSLDIKSRKNKGTTLIISIPFDGADTGS